MKPPPVPTRENLSADQKQALKVWCHEKYPELMHKGSGGIGELIDECLDHFRALENPKRYKDWSAVIRNWVRRHVRWEAEREARRPAQYGDAARKTEAQLRVIDGGKPR